MIGAGRVDRHIDRGVALGRDFIFNEPGFEFLAANIGEHVAIDFDARRKLLAAFLDHFLPLARIVPDVPVLEREVVFFQDGADSLAPAAEGFQVSDNFWFFHVRILQWTWLHRN